MSTKELIIAEEFCEYHHIQLSVIQSFHESGLIETVIEEQRTYIPEEQLPQLEKLVQLYEMGINVEGLEVVTHLLAQMHAMQQELRLLNNKVHALM